MSDKHRSWYKIFADGTELDIVNADSPEEAV
jgi:hypothetical protein